MAKIPKRFEKAFFEAQKEVHAAVRPWQGRCTSQLIDGTFGAVENFVLCSKEPDCGGDPEKGEPHDRHRWRGMLTVWYTFDRERCSVCCSYSEDMVSRALDIPIDNTWAHTVAVIERLIP